MSERLNVCQALAAMIRQAGEPTEEEVTFIGMAAMQLGLDQGENEQVQKTLKEGGDFDKALAEIKSKTMRAFLFRRLLAATLLDEKITDQEQALIDKTATAFDVNPQLAAHLVAWMTVSIEIEKRLVDLLGQI